MAESEELIDNAEVEASLSRLRPRAPRLERDRVMFEAGQASARSASRPGSRWPRLLATVAGWLVAAVILLAWETMPEVRVVVRERDVPDRESPAEPDDSMARERLSPLETASAGEGADRETPPQAVRGTTDPDLERLISSRLGRLGRVAPRDEIPSASTTIGERQPATYVELKGAWLRGASETGPENANPSFWGDRL